MTASPREPTAADATTARAVLNYIRSLHPNDGSSEAEINVEHEVAAILTSRRADGAGEFWHLATDDPASWPEHSDASVLCMESPWTLWTFTLRSKVARGQYGAGRRGWYAYARDLPPLPGGARP